MKIQKLILLAAYAAFCFAANTSDNFTFVKDSEDVYRLSFTMDEVTLQSVGEYSKIISKSDGYTETLGMPELPTYTSIIMIDPNAQYELNFSVISSRVLTDIKVFPNQLMVNGLEADELQDIDYSFYNSSQSYPLKNISLSEPMVMRDINLSFLQVIPFEYSPVTEELTIYESIEITITKSETGRNSQDLQMPRSKVFEKIYSEKVINYETSSREEDYQTPAILYICGGSSENSSSLESLIDWRNERGYVVYTASVSDIGSSTTQIKNYISNAYQNFTPPPEYVALVGDVGGNYNIPTYYEGWGHNSYGNDCEGDLQYSQLDGNDLLPEVLIGRMSIRSSSELSTVTSKILNYEKATYLDALGDYYENAAMAGDPSSSGNSCAITKEYVKETLEAHGFEDVDIKTSGSSWSNWMEDELEDGVLYFNYRGYLGMSGFSSGNITNANSGYKLPFATILTCGTGSFAEDQTTMSESFFRSGSANNPKGGVAAIGTATWNTHTLFNNIIDMGIYDGILADRVQTAGAALASGKLALLSAYPENYDNWVSAFTQWNNLMGDPATHLWTDTPSVIAANHPSVIPVGTNFFGVDVTDTFGNPIEDALVTWYIPGSNNPINILTDEFGSVEFSVGSEVSGQSIITVTKEDHKPYQGQCAVSEQSENINLDYSSSIVVNDGNDGTIASGETIGISVPIFNYGTSDAVDVTASILSSSEHVSIQTGEVSYGSISPGQSMYSDDFVIFVLPTAVDGEDLGVYINISDSSGNQWSSALNLDVIGSLLTPTLIVDIDPGETQSLNLLLENIGSLTASGVTSELVFQGTEITINNSYSSWGNIHPGSLISCEECFNITASNDVINGVQIMLTLQIESEDGYNRTEIISMSIGRTSETDPLGPDQYGYYIYDSGDIDYNLVPTYNWIEIDPGNGGDGADLNLSSSGNGNWNGSPTADVNLPFSFSFYGVEYSDITISTNGWIAFGETDMESFRNYPIPGAGGPSPMIAAFWDDLKTTSGGDVSTYSTGDSFIIQWDDMSTQNNNSNETFQIILYNDSAPPYGDNTAKVQYKDFNNTSSGNFDSYPPIHGGYATIGTENHLGNDGLQYTFNNIYPPAAMDLGDETAIYITTESPITLPAPELSYSSDSFNFTLEEGETSSDILTISNTGEEGSILSYSLSQTYQGAEPPFSNPGGGPDASGYYWTDSDLESDINYQWVDISGESTQASFSTNDSDTELIDIGFNFPFYGSNYEQFLINANGWIGFGEGSDAWYNGDIPSTEAPKPAIFGFWDDLNPINDSCNETCSGNVYYNSNSDRLVVWYDDVYHWASGGFEDSYYDFQIVIYPTGEIDINVREVVGSYSATVGIQNASGTVATQVDQYNGDYFNSEVSFRFESPYSADGWMDISSPQGLSGEIYDGESIDFAITVDASDINSGEYFANINLSTSVEEGIDIPVSLVVADDNMLLGDINEDGELNVLDVVSMVSIILDTGGYNPSGDLNQDGELNVLDVVALVNIILDI